MLACSSPSLIIVIYTIIKLYKQQWVIWGFLCPGLCLSDNKEVALSSLLRAEKKQPGACSYGSFHLYILLKRCEKLMQSKIRQYQGNQQPGRCDSVSRSGQALGGKVKMLFSNQLSSSVLYLQRYFCDLMHLSVMITCRVMCLHHWITYRVWDNLRCAECKGGGRDAVLIQQRKLWMYCEVLPLRKLRLLQHFRAICINRWYFEFNIVLLIWA